MTSRSPQRRGETFRASVIAFVCHVAIGTIGLFFVFLMAYGFAEEITPTLHVVFLLGFAVVAGLSLLAATATATSARLPWRAALRLGASSTAAAYGLALAAGVVVSMLNEGQNSVTADQADWPFVLVAVAAAAVSALGWLALLRGPRRR